MPDKLKILQSAPIDIEVSPNLKYAGTERIVYALHQSYDNLGHDIITACSGDSDLSGYGTHLPTQERGLWSRTGLERKIPTAAESEAAHEAHFRRVLEYAAENGVDIIHDHPGAFLVTSRAYQESGSKVPILTTVHEDISGKKAWKYDIMKELQKAGKPVFFNAISRNHLEAYERRSGIDIGNFVYNGIPVEIFPFVEQKQDYLFWIGRISDIKGTDLAVQMAKRTGRPLIIAGEVHTPYRAFYEEKIEPHLTGIIKEGSEDVQEAQKNQLLERLEAGEEIVKDGEIFYIGAVDDRQKAILYSHAHTTLVPNRWEEPFGLVMIESMATGTPVVATATGALPELVKQNETGFIVEPVWKNRAEQELHEEASLERLVEGLERTGRIKNVAANSRNHVEQNFDRKIMAANYINLYQQILDNLR